MVRCPCEARGELGGLSPLVVAASCCCWPLCGIARLGGVAPPVYEGSSSSPIIHCVDTARGSLARAPSNKD
ncbi:hypothetical protein Taro_009855 [Colocasia esculenta]|uniref:Uncharacterized protein n=1 Tax=Colocasia esculenta TaxID=4460 RepID=A0A843U622_COLES|nr:hypothetical protein [Colocasia esculenta]